MKYSGMNLENADMCDEKPSELKLPSAPPPTVLPGQVQFLNEPLELDKLYAITSSCEQLMGQVNDRLGRLEASGVQHYPLEGPAQTAALLRIAGAEWRST